MSKVTDKDIRDTLILNGERVSTADMKQFWQERPDPDFSPERNKAVIASSIRKAEKHRAEMQRLQAEGLAERTNALATYVKARVDGRTHKTADDYFGRKEMARLAGKKVMQILKERKANGQPLWEVISTQNDFTGYK